MKKRPKKEKPQKSFDTTKYKSVSMIATRDQKTGNLVRTKYGKSVFRRYNGKSTME